MRRLRALRHLAGDYRTSVPVLRCSPIRKQSSAMMGFTMQRSPATGIFGYWQLRLPESEMVRNVIVAGAKVTVPGLVGMPARLGSRSTESGANGVPFSRTVTCCSFGASSVYRAAALGRTIVCDVSGSLLMTSNATPPDVLRWQCA